MTKQFDLAARKKRRLRKTSDSKHLDPIAPNVLDRDFEVALPNAAGVTDVTHVWTHEGGLYLAAILDMFSRRVVGWKASADNDRPLALGAGRALDRGQDARRVLDRGHFARMRSGGAGKTTAARVDGTRGSGAVAVTG